MSDIRPIYVRGSLVDVGGCLVDVCGSLVDASGSLVDVRGSSRLMVDSRCILLIRRPVDVR